MGLLSGAAQASSLLLDATGVLSQGDATLEQDGSFYDLHTFEGEAGQQVSIDMESQEFDTFLWLFAPDGQEIAQNDDAAEQITSDSAIAVTLPQTGTYTIAANAHSSGMGGQYTVTVHVSNQTGR